MDRNEMRSGVTVREALKEDSHSPWSLVNSSVQLYSTAPGEKYVLNEHGGEFNFVSKVVLDNHE